MRLYVMALLLMAGSMFMDHEHLESGTIFFACGAALYIFKWTEGNQ